MSWRRGGSCRRPAAAAFISTQASDQTSTASCLANREVEDDWQVGGLGLRGLLPRPDGLPSGKNERGKLG
jgi:hypothetical protein